MTGIYSVTPSLTDDVSDFFKKAFSAISEFSGRAYVWIQNLPREMQGNRNVAVAVFAVANLTFLTLTNLVVKRMDKKIESAVHPQPLDTSQKIVKDILLNGVIVGGSVFTFNFILSKATQYPLSNVALTAITAAVVATRILLTYLPGKDNLQEEVDEKQEEEEEEVSKEKVEGNSSEDENSSEGEQELVINQQLNTNVT
jgi:hypothetical protein